MVVVMIYIKLYTLNTFVRTSTVNEYLQTHRYEIWRSLICSRVSKLASVLTSTNFLHVSVILTLLYASQSPVSGMILWMVNNLTGGVPTVSIARNVYTSIVFSKFKPVDSCVEENKISKYYYTHMMKNLDYWIPGSHFAVPCARFSSRILFRNSGRVLN